MRARLLAPPLLASLALAGCGDTLYTARGLPPSGGSQCTDGAAPLSCVDGSGTPVCVAHDLDHCAACDDVCPAAPANAAGQCRESAPGAGDWACAFECNPGFLKSGAGCDRAAAVAAGDAHSCAVTVGGRLKCWGANGAGQVTGAPASGGVLVPHDLSTGVAHAAAGAAHTCAVHLDGSVECWGSAAASLGKPAALPGTTALVAGGDHTCSLAGGAVTCWGSDAAAAIPAGFLPAAVDAIGSGARHACALAGGGVYCWGANDQGQLGGGAAADVSFSPIASGATAVGAGSDRSCAALGGSGSLQCWGSGDLSAASKVSFAVDALAVGAAHVCVHRLDEAVKCFGSNDLGQLAQPEATAIDPASLYDATIDRGSYALAGGQGHVCAIFPDMGLRCWGANASGQVGNGAPAAATYSPTPVSGR